MSHPSFLSGQWNAFCNCCGQEKLLEEFYTHSNGKPRKQCKACHYSRGQRWRGQNREHVNQKNRDGSESQKQARRDACAAWRKANLEYDAFRARTYRARKQRQVPTWANLDKIKEIYLNCPKGYHVDHVVPLKGKTVSGLHVETNLQYLPAIDNIRKRNIYHE